MKPRREPFDKAKAITADTKRPIRQFFWSRDGKFVLYVQDQGGDENFNVYAVDPAAAPAAGAEVPVARNLTEAKGVRALIYQVSKVDPDVMFVGINDRDAAWHDVYRLKISTGERTLIRKNTDRIAGWEFDLKDQLRLAVRTTDKGDTEILRVDDGGFTKIYECGVLRVVRDREVPQGRPARLPARPTRVTPTCRACRCSTSPPARRNSSRPTRRAAWTSAARCSRTSPTS